MSSQRVLRTRNPNVKYSDEPPTPARVYTNSNLVYHFQVRNNDRAPWRDIFVAPMKQQVCEHSGCSRVNVIGLERCAEHMSSDLGVRIGPSLHGQGLFATRPFREGEVFGFTYLGEQITLRTKQQRYQGHTAPYGIDNADVTQDEKTCLDAATIRGVAAMINHSDSPNVRARLSVAPDTSTIIEFSAKQAIPAGHELFLDYNEGHAKPHAVHYLFSDNERSIILPNEHRSNSSKPKVYKTTAPKRK